MLAFPLTLPRRSPRPLLAWSETARTVAAALVSVTALGACGQVTVPEAAPVASPSTIQIAPELLQPLTMLGPCSEVTDPQLGLVAEGLVLPDSAFLLERTEQGELVNVRGYVPLTPIMFQLFLREQDGLEMITVENEIQEAETLYSDGTHRVFTKAAAVCELGTVFIAVIAAELDGDAVPTPSGTPTG